MKPNYVIFKTKLCRRVCTLHSLLFSSQAFLYDTDFYSIFTPSFPTSLSFIPSTSLSSSLIVIL